MDTKEARKDLKQRQQVLVDELNKIKVTQKQLAIREQELIVLAHNLNGEKDMLNKLSDNGKKQKK